MHNVFMVGANTAQKSKNRLHKERRFYQTTISKVSEVIQMRDIITLELKPGTVSLASFQHILDILERIAKHKIFRPFKVFAFPIEFECFVSFQHRIEAEVHGAHI